MERIVNAIIEDDFEWFVELVKKTGFDQVDSNGFTPLMYCILHERPRMVDFLLENAIDVNRQNGVGNTALFYAIFKSKDKIGLIEKLLTKGADMNIANGAGVSPLSLANSMANENVRNFMNNWKK
ncbi:ankyrin repeat domain-containing protein [Fibrobacter sp.]|uniref:ankyrin repeat domain-containing protein n=1 Tax=Fibrobacter sp. TaxID=35828 RepID=UPI0025C6B836|nr:ankyrin repeat domain-containing protein [Fibrobacter sp.]MBS7272738.1 ankyrin repeat domain-containing protein [Fibrobacter sp.]